MQDKDKIGILVLIIIGIGMFIYFSKGNDNSSEPIEIEEIDDEPFPIHTNNITLDIIEGYVNSKTYCTPYTEKGTYHPPEYGLSVVIGVNHTVFAWTTEETFYSTNAELRYRDIAIEGSIVEVVKFGKGWYEISHPKVEGYV